jgi:hypothetical protein
MSNTPSYSIRVSQSSQISLLQLGHNPDVYLFSLIALYIGIRNSNLSSPPFYRPFNFLNTYINMSTFVKESILL